MQKEVEVTNHFPDEFYQLAKAHDLYRCSLPEKYGGFGLSELEILKVQEEFSRGPGGMRMHRHYAMDLNWRILDQFGSEELKDKYMGKFQDKSIFTCFALTEESGGSGADLHTMAVKDGDDYILNGEKTLISHTDCCQFAYVIAVTNRDGSKEERLSAFFVPVDTPGYEILPMPHLMGCRGAGHAKLKFTDMRVNKKYLLGKEGEGLRVAMYLLGHFPGTYCSKQFGHGSAYDGNVHCSGKGSGHLWQTFGKPPDDPELYCRNKMGTYIHALRTMVYDFAQDFDAGKDPGNQGGHGKIFQH